MVARVMGIVNVTPDSFSDGGRWLEPSRAIAHARRLISEGASIIDIGGESTRPGSRPVDEDVELERVLPVIIGVSRALATERRDRGRVEISIDTTKVAVATAAVEAGATIINDVSARLEHVAFQTGAGWVAVHTPEPSVSMQDDPHYDDVVAEVGAYLSDALRRGAEAGVSRVWIDPGIGFGKTLAHNLELLANLDALVEIAARSDSQLLVGVSRKGSIGELHARTESVDAVAEDDRLEGSVALAAWASRAGGDVVRVHDVEATVDAFRVVARHGWERAA